jgi:uncharacterized protein
MHAPTITAAYLAVLALIYTALSIRVVGMRRGNRIGFGDGGNAALRAAIRAHAHFAEYVPIIVLMLGALELFGTGAVRLHMLLGTLVVSRILHPFGLVAKPSVLRGSRARNDPDPVRPGHERADASAAPRLELGSPAT